MKWIAAISLSLAVGLSAGCQQQKKAQALEEFPPAASSGTPYATTLPPLPPPPPGPTDGLIPPPPGPGTVTPLPPAGGQRTHVVAPGETLWKISAKYYGTANKANVQKILSANPGVTDASKISVGQKLIIP